MTPRPAILVLLAGLLFAACDQASVGQTGAGAAPKMPPVSGGLPVDANSGDMPLARFKANGNSPAWRAEIDGEKIVFELPEKAGPDPTKRTTKVERLAYAKGADYNGKDGAVEFTLTIDGKECVKTGDKREFTATFRYGKSTYYGCADGVR